MSLLYTVVYLLKAPAMICPPLRLRVPRIPVAIFTSLVCAFHVYPSHFFTFLFRTFHVYASGTRSSPNLFLILYGNVGKSAIKMAEQRTKSCQEPAVSRSDAVRSHLSNHAHGMVSGLGDSGAGEESVASMVNTAQSARSWAAASQPGSSAT